MERTILILDDEQPARAVLEMLPKHEGFTCIKTAMDKQVLEIVRSNHVDLLIQDMRREGNDAAGCKLVRILKADPQLRQIPILIVSSAPEEKAKKLFAEIGVDFASIAGYLSKPFSNRELVAKIKAIVGG